MPNSKLLVVDQQLQVLLWLQKW